MVGLAIDAGMLYLTYGQLKRAVDSAAVAAANDFKRGETIARMTEAAKEVLRLQNVNVEDVDLNVYICDSNGDGIRDASLQTTVPRFYDACPDTPTYAPRKLIWVDAKLAAPLYFLHLVGAESVNLQTEAIAEAAPIDLVIVMDTSESMASDTIEALKPTYPDIVDNYNPDGTIPSGCNLNNSCQPLKKAKDAAKALVNTLYQGYDRVSIVTFNQLAVVRPIQNTQGITTDLSDDLTKVKAAIDADVKLWDDPPFARMWSPWKGTPIGSFPVFNPVNPEDRNGDGADTDTTLPTCAENPFSPVCCNLNPSRWDDTKDPYGWGGLPCDDPTKFDAYDWNGNGIFDQSDHDASVAWLNKAQAQEGSFVTLSPLSTCTGCGMRMAGNVLKQHGRSGAVWVIVFLSDGIANLSDRPETNTAIPAAYKTGFCTGRFSSNPADLNFWRTYCIDFNLTPRYCIDTDSSTCPPTSIWDTTNPSLQYSVMDYARDITDEVALTRSLNLHEPGGNDIALYTIGLGAAGNVIPGKGAIGEQLLRYFASVGDDGDRETDPCAGAPAKTNCGQYYYAPSGDALLPIFENIASRIYTKITQ